MSETKVGGLIPEQIGSREVKAGRGLVFFIYMIAGPPIGGALFLLGFMGYGIFAETGPTFLSKFDETAVLRFFATLPMIFGFTLLFGYFLGGLQAAGAGLILTLMSDKNGRFGYGLAFLAAIVPSLLGAWLWMGDAPGFAAILFSLGLAASLVLRFLFRKRFGRR